MDALAQVKLGKETWTINIFISEGGKPEVPFESLTQAQQQETGKKIARKMAECMEAYWSRNPAEYAAWCAAHPEAVL